MSPEAQPDGDIIIVGRAQPPNPHAFSGIPSRNTTHFHGQNPRPPVGMPSEHVDSAPHACRNCNARFTRLEHLQRHITSLHRGHSPKPHGCQFCGKRFSRRDVLLRHHQSCRAAKQSSAFVEQNLRPAKRACQTCNELKLKCSGGPRCEKCADLGQDCVFATRRQKANKQQQAAPWPSPPSQMESEESVRLLSPGPFCDASQIDPALTQEAQESGFLSCSTRPEASGLAPQHEAGLNAVAQNEASIGWEGWPSHENQRDDEQRANSVTDGQSPKVRKPGNKRGRYVSNACMNCQKRKVKCSGEETCLQCRSAELLCVYNHGRKRRKTTGSREERSINLEATKALPSASTSSEDQASLSEKMLHMMARIASLERDCKMFKNQIAVTANDHEGYVPDHDTSSPSGSCATSLPENEFFKGATCLFKPMEVLNRTVACEGEDQPDSRAESPVPAQPTSTAVTWHSLPPPENKDIETLEKETRSSDILGLRHSIDIFFSHLNPHYPCLNENQFRTQFESFLANDITQLSNADRHQFIALVNLIQAEVKLLGDDWSDSNCPPAWQEFCRAESILNPLIWLGNGNILTIQCLLIKARYLLYIEKSDGAYDTMGRVVRLCFKLGLNDQASWSGCTPFEIVMRQRIFWTIFYLERNVSFNTGAPYLIRESDFKVDLPKNFDDKYMYPNEPLPEETPERSSSPYLSGAAKWGKLCSEVWDVVFGTNAQKPASQEFVASMDARILYTVSQLPVHLQWQRNTHRLGGNTDVPPYVLRQTIILHLRMNQLRLLLRQESILSMKYNDAIAEECVSIAASSIDALHIHHDSQAHKPTGRFSSVLYLVGALLPLVCIIVKSDNVQQTRADAIEAFKKGLSMMNQMYPNFSCARHTLRRIRRIVATAKKAISRFHHAEPFAVEPKEFEAETLIPPVADFFNLDHPMDGDEDMLNQMLNGISTSPDFSGMADTMDVFWVDDDLRRLFEMNGGF